MTCDLARGTALEPEGVGEALHAVRLRLARLRVRLAGLGHRLGADAVLGAGERQQVAQLGGVEHELRPEARSPRRCRGRSPARRRCARRPRSPRSPWCAGARAGGRRRRAAAAARGSRRPRPRGSKASRVTQQLPGLKSARSRSLHRQRAVVPAQRLAQRIVAGGAAEGLDVLVLVERGHALRRELAAEPVGLLQQVDVAAARARRRAPRPRRRCRRRRPAPRSRSSRAGAAPSTATTATAGSPASGHAHDVDDGVDAALDRRPASFRHRARQPQRDLREGDDQARARGTAGRCTATPSGRCRPA